MIRIRVKKFNLSEVGEIGAQNVQDTQAKFSWMGASSQITHLQLGRSTRYKYCHMNRNIISEI